MIRAGMLAVAAFIGLAGSPVRALSCMEPDVAHSFLRADQSPDDIVILRGVLVFDAAQMPAGVDAQERQPAAVPAQFTGAALTRDGFTSPLDADVTLQPRCFGPWCGSAVPGRAAIVFATVAGQGLHVDIGPCGGAIFYDPTPAMEQRLLACLRGASCP